MFVDPCVKLRVQKGALLRGVLSSLCVLALSAPGMVSASPWTLPQHDLVVSTDFSFASASKEFLNDGTNQLYSVNGQLRTSSLALSLRYGFTDNFEMEIRPTFKQLSYKSDPVLLGVLEEPYSLDDARSQIIDFDSSVIGAGDMDLVGRYSLLRSKFLLVTAEGGSKIPLGYKQPQGTFSSLDFESAQFEVGDDATLGDGQIDIHAGLLFGTYVPLSRTFARVDTAYNHRFSTPGDQVLANVKVGQYLGQSLILVGGVRWAKTITDGEPIGETFVDTDPGQSAQQFDSSKVDVRPLYLDRDYTIVELGVIAQFEHIEFRVAVEDVLDGRNYADLRTLNFGLSSKFIGATRSEELPASVVEPEENDEQQPTEEEIIEEVIVVPADGIQEGTTTTIDEDGNEIIEEVIIEVVEPDEDGSDTQGSEGEDKESTVEP